MIMQQTDMSPAKRLDRISEQGLCIGCGLCQSIAGPDKVRIVDTPDGALRPVAGNDLDHADVDRIYLTCPGTRIEGLPDALADGDTRTDLVWGPYRDMVIAHAADPDVRFEAAAGGALTALALYLLESGDVDFILHATAHKDRPSYGAAHVSRTREQVLAGAGSRYGPTATLIDIDALLARGERFAVIGTPCDISALRNLSTLDPRVGERVPYMLAMVCGGFMQTPALAKALRGFGVDFDALTALRYRGHGCPGPTRAETADGTVVEKTYLDFWGEDDSAWSLPFRCKICPDAIGEATDIAVADVWPGGAPTAEQAANHRADPGFNGLIVRTAAGRDLVARAERGGYLTTVRGIGPRDMDDFQPHQVKKKHAAWSRHMGLAASGGMAPVTARLRLAELAAARGAEDILDQAAGTRRRILDGKTGEPPPRPA